MNKIQKIVAGIFGGIGVLGALLATTAQVAAAQVMSTTTLGTSIDTLSGTTYDYFGVLLNKLWPFVVGFVILIGVWYLARRFIHSFR